jgi:hypothetical protein
VLVAPPLAAVWIPLPPNPEIELLNRVIAELKRLVAVLEYQGSLVTRRAAYLSPS